MSGAALLQIGRNGVPLSRTKAVSEAAQAHHTELDKAKFHEALSWSRGRLRTRSVITVNDEVSRPLLMAERLTSLAKADQTTILAAVLYPAVRPVAGKLDESALKYIEYHFGLDVFRLVKQTLKLQALDYIEPGQDVCSKEKHLQQFRLMALWAAIDPRAILIRSTQNVLELENCFPRTHREGRQSRHKKVSQKRAEYLIWLANEVIAPIAYLAGYSKLRERVMDLAFELEDPREYRRVKEILDRSRFNDPQVVSDVSRKLTKLLAAHGIPSDAVIIEMNPKSPGSAREKSKRKNIPVEKMADLAKFRIILNDDFIEQRGLNSADLMSDVHYIVSSQYGRNSNDEQIKVFFRELAVINPHPDNPEQDNYFDNYIDGKANGYSSLQDSFLLDGVHAEGQMLNQGRHENNTYGPRAGHIYYKTGLGDEAEVVMKWREVAAAAIQGKEYEVLYTYAFGPAPDNHIKGGERLTPNCFANGAKIIGAYVHNNDPFVHHDPERIIGANAPLLTGDRIVRLEYV